MKPLLSLFTLAAWAMGTVVAQEPPAPRTTGSVLLMANHQLLEGDIEYREGVYRIHRAVGETTIPAAEVLVLCQTRLEAYEHLKRRANLRDPEERMRLSRWCLAHGLRQQALEEARAARDLAPKSTEIRLMVQGLQQSQDQPEPARTIPSTESRATLDVVQEIPEPAEYNTDSFALFATKVQPILMNTCARCHASPDVEKFHLLRVHDQRGNRRATYHNLAAALKYVDRENPNVSLLLTKAVTVHGEANQPPIRHRQMMPYQLLDQWVRQAVSPEGSPAPSLTSQPAPKVVSSPEPVPVPRGNPVSLDPTATTPFATTPPKMPSKPIPNINPAQPNIGQVRPSRDPFDPAIFNQTVPEVVPKKR